MSIKISIVTRIHRYPLKLIFKEMSFINPVAVSELERLNGVLVMDKLEVTLRMS